MIELPVPRQRVAIVAEQRRLAAVERRLEFGQHLRPQIILKRFHVVDVGGEHDAAMRGDVEPVQAVIGVLEIGRHAALAVDATPERNPHEVALQIVCPLVIRADELLGVAAQLATEFRRAMRTAILEDMDRTVFGARDHDWSRTNVGANEIAGLRQFAFQRDIVPGAAVKNPLDLALVDDLIGVDPVRDAREALGWPDVAVRQRRCGIDVHVRLDLPNCQLHVVPEATAEAVAAGWSRLTKTSSPATFTA